MKLPAFLLLALTFAFPHPTRADEPILKINVGQAKVKRSLVAFPQYVLENDQGGQLAALHDVTMKDLDFTGLVDFLNSAAFVEPAGAGITPDKFKLSDWSTIGAELLIKGKASLTADAITLDLFVYGVTSGKLFFAKKYTAKPGEGRALAHTVSNDVLFALTGRKGPFTSRIAFVSDKTGSKKLYVMDYDGSNPISVTPVYKLAISPAWSPDGKQILFTTETVNAEGIHNHDLYSYDLPSRHYVKLSGRKGLNSGAVFSPDGAKIALTMSFSGDSKLYLLDVKTHLPQRLTSGFGIDVDPSFSPDGKKIAFVSDRGGKSMIYSMNAADGTDVTRLVFTGDYNATPRFSPSGEKIAFAGWENGTSDIFVMNPDGSQIERLTQNMGKNEAPDFSPDGYFLAYSSERAGQKNIYVTNLDNTIHRQITKDFGNCESPRWSPLAQ